MKFFSYICKCVALDTGMCEDVSGAVFLVCLDKFQYF